MNEQTLAFGSSIYQKMTKEDIVWYRDRLSGDFRFEPGFRDSNNMIEIMV